MSYDFSGWASALPPAAFYAILGAWLFVESTGFPISDEPLLLFAGYLTAIHRLQLAPTILVALTGKVAASYLAFWLGRRLDLARLARPDRRPAAGFGRWLFVLRPNRDTLRGVAVFFGRWGGWSVFLGRLVPVVRSFISYPAGASRMPSGVFLIATTAGSALWIVTWTALGALLGRAYSQAAARWGPLSWLLLLVVCALGVGLWIWHRAHALASGPPRADR